MPQDPGEEIKVFVWCVLLLVVIPVVLRYIFDYLF